MCIYGWCVHIECNTCGHQERLSDVLELELQGAVGFLLWALVSKLGSSAKSSKH